jgi:asparagine synthase (glutamine-hydrolysing)
MPGVTLSYLFEPTRGSVGRTDGTPSARALVRRGLDRALTLDHFEATPLVDEGPFAAGAVSYANYPVRELDVDGGRAILEGRIYTADPGATAREAVQHVLDDAGGRLADWVGSTDGEFVLTVYDPAEERLTVVNDVFGRLPLYWTESDGRLTVSRDLSALLTADPGRRRVAADQQFDEMGIAQSLLFGFPLGTRTLFDGVTKLAPGTLLTAGPEGVTTRSLHEFDLEALEARSDGSAHDVRVLADEFTEACEAREAHHAKTVISLSGGLDSRAVGAGFSRAGVPFETVTFDRADGVSDRDLPVAESVADALGVPWHRYDLPEVTRESRDTLIGLKQGMNHIGMGFILPFLETLRDTYGPEFTYVTGDGGDKALPDLTPPREFADLEDLVEYVVTKDSLGFDLDEVTRLLDVTESEVKATLRDELASYPESSPSQVYKHYKVRERGLNWLNEGEDRNRAYAWSTTPFYSLPFFETAMSFADSEKRTNKLYRRFMAELWTDGVDLPDANYGVRMSSPLYTSTMYFRKFLANHPAIEDVVRVVYRGEVGASYDERLAERLQRQLANSSEIRTVFDAERLDEIAADRTSCSRQQAMFLLTMTSVVASAMPRQEVATSTVS